MGYATAQRCRICGQHQFHSILDLGRQALTGVFPRSRTEDVPTGPVELIKCDESHGGCGLVQMRHTYEPQTMYGQNYGYRSGLNKSMVEHLQRRVRVALEKVEVQPGDLVLDIGSNDGTTLRSYPKLGLQRVGMDPTGRKFAAWYPNDVALIPDFFSAEEFRRRFPERKAKIVTSLAMFYDLESPQEFMADVREVLDDDGVWVFEQSYLPLMLRQNAYDTVCQEHISYYALKQILWMTDRAGLKIIDVELNDVNGGSFCVTVAKDTSPYPAAIQRVETLLEDEQRAGLGGLRPYEEFRQAVFHHRDELRKFVAAVRADGRTVYGYGASTKGNVMLQFCGFTDQDIPAIAEVNEDKFGAFTPGSLIPIQSEAKIRRLMPDFWLVFPWHFRAGIIRREEEYLSQGGKLVFPLPWLAILEQPRMETIPLRKAVAARAA